MSSESGKDGLSRRDLVRRAGAGTAVLTLPGFLAACGASSTKTTTSTDAKSAPKRGGRLRVAFVGGGSVETLDPNRGAAIAEIGIATATFEKLYELRGSAPTLTPVLAESMEPNAKGDVWTLRIKQGIKWHDGKPFTIDDVMYTFRRILDPKSALAGAAVISFIDPKGMKKLDDHTVRLQFAGPFADPTPAFSTRYLPIIQDGTTSFSHPVGTGPFVFQQFTPGKNARFTANKDYHGGAPYIDELSYVDIPDNTARVNALLGGQVDAIEALPGAQAKVLGRNPAVKLLQAKNGGHSKMCFQVTAAPFDDSRVRQALRLLCDRPRTIENAVFGRGEIGNDIPCRFDPMYDHDIPQRTYDPDKAKALLKAAGHSSLNIVVESSSASVGMLESAQVFAETARAGGVTVKVRTNPADTYFSKVWGNAPFYQDEWGFYSLHDQLAVGYATKAPYNGTKYSDPKVDKLLADASQTLDEAQRKDKYASLQQILWDSGPDIIWGSPAVLDAVSKKVNGLEPSPVRPLGAFRFDKVWIG